MLTTTLLPDRLHLTQSFTYTIITVIFIILPDRLHLLQTNHHSISSELHIVISIIIVAIILWTIRCTLLVEETIPRGAFVDPDEMRDLRSIFLIYFHSRIFSTLLLLIEYFCQPLCDDGSHVLISNNPIVIR